MSGSVRNGLQPRPRGRSGQRRCGSLIIECVIAAALIATATVALTRLARNSVALNQQSDNRFAAKLTAENLLQRSQQMEADQLADQIGPLAAAMAEEYATEITASANPFESGDHRGLHLRIDVRSAPNAQVTIHDWRVFDETPEVVEESDEDTETTNAPENENGESDDASE